MGPLEITVSRRFLDRHPKSCVHGTSPIYALLILGKGTAGRLDHREHCEVVDANVPEDLLAWERRSGEQETLYSKGFTRQKLPSVCILHGCHRIFLSPIMIPAMATWTYPGT